MGCSSSKSEVVDSEHIVDDVWKLFKKGRTLGAGGYGQVLSVEDRATGEKLAMKQMERFHNGNKTTFYNEVSILRSLHSPNIVAFKDAYIDPNHFYILSELCTGGELFDRIVEHERFSEKVAAALMRQVLEAIAAAHRNNIAHLDIKPENLVFATPDKDSPLKLIDFGCAKQLKPKATYNGTIGTPYYIAPQMLDQNMQQTAKEMLACDMWSLGVVLFLLVTGRPPFGGTSNNHIFARIRRGVFSFPEELQLSEAVQSLIRRLIDRNPANRLTADQALEDPWVRGEAAADILLTTVAAGLRNFSSHCRLKKALARVLVGHMSDRDRDALSSKFSELDKDGSGRLETGELVKLLTGFGGEDQVAAASNVKAILAETDADGDGEMNQEEFLHMHVRGQLTNDEGTIAEAFQRMDKNHDGVLTQDEIIAFLATYPANGIASMFSEVDSNGDGLITFEEFLRAMTGQAAAATTRVPSPPY